MEQKKTYFKKGALYIRVSTHGRQEELSPDAQKRLLLDYAQKHGILTDPLYIYVERGISGKNAEKRPEFQRMIADAKSAEHPFDIILIWKFSRFARNQEESIVYKSLLRRQCRVEVQSVSEPLLDGPFGSLIERIIEWMDEFYSVNLSGEVTRGMTERAMRGGYQSRPPIGYRMPPGSKLLSVVPEEAEIVRLIFNSYAVEKLSVPAIVKKLNDCGFKTAAGSFFERRSVLYILQNPVYCGKIRWNRTCGSTGHEKPSSEWILADGQHPPVITEELFSITQNRLANLSKAEGFRPAPASPHWLSGLFKCPVCGKSMCVHTIQKNSRTYRYFRCCGASKGTCPYRHSVSISRIEPYLKDTLKSLFLSCSLAFSSLPPAAPEECGLPALRAQLNRLLRQEERLRTAYLSGADSLDEYRFQKEAIRKEQKKLLDWIHAFSPDFQNLPENPAPGGKNGKAAGKICSASSFLFSDSVPDPEKNKILKSFISSIVYEEEPETLTICYNIRSC